MYETTVTVQGWLGNDVTTRVVGDVQVASFRVATTPRRYRRQTETWVEGNTQWYAVTAWRALAEKYGINRPGGQVFVTPLAGTWYYAFNHSRPAFRGRGQIPLKKAINFAIDRPALARTFGYLFGKRTDQMLPPALAPIHKPPTPQTRPLRWPAMC